MLFFPNLPHKRLSFARRYIVRQKGESGLNRLKMRGMARVSQPAPLPITNQLMTKMYVLPYGASNINNSRDFHKPRQSKSIIYELLNYYSLYAYYVSIRTL